MDLECPRCGGTEFLERDCGADTEDSPAWTAYICHSCNLYYSSWTDRWYKDVESSLDEDAEHEYEPEE